MNDPKRPRQTAADFPPEVLRLFDQYVHGGIDRRGFLDGATRFYDEAAAKQEAWARTIALFNRTLRG